MRLLIVLLTYNRLEYTKRTLKSLLDTIDTPYYLLAVDNNSTDGTQEWLKKNKKINHVILNPDNYYPGKAMNIAWTEGIRLYPEATHLMRLDNDIILKKSWDKVCQKYFEAIPNLGQLGYEHTAIEHPEAETMMLDINGKHLYFWPGNIGGPCIISRQVWEDGLRYKEDRWNHRNSNYPWPQEDSFFSRDIALKGYLFGHTEENIGMTFADASNWDDYPEYYIQTMTERGYKNVYKETLDRLKELADDQHTVSDTQETI